MKTNKIQHITGALVVVMALVFAGLLAFDNILSYLSGWKRITTILVLILYGSFRFLRIYKDLKKKDPS